MVEDVLSMLDVEESMLDVAAQERRELRRAAGVQWVALRQCFSCDNVACCDSSPLQHATEHFHEDGHPVIQSAEPGEDWRWCYVHHTTA